ncbi:MAG: type I-C CRISPR-associated protein Cas5 [Ruminococcus sp.]|nr:type I-C CRISPR-associated protein Cas5 [Ruminococcus sp.]MBQ3935745.1 type I-C CRISPR-associated protein Cas5 [Ruminococcus sp.]
MSYGFKVIVEGDYALFTHNAMKVERVSYDVPTVSALEGLIKSVYWKPPIRYVIDRIIVFNPIKFINVRRNELKSKIPLSAVRNQMKGVGSAQICASEERTQRAGMILKDVKYGIEFHFELTGLKADHADESEEKHYNILLRRLKNGQCFRQPCLGCREFAVNSIQLVEDFDLSAVDESLKGDIDLGYMLYRMNFEDGGRPINNDWDSPKFSDKADPVYYRPHMINGVIDVKKYKEGVRC